MDYGLRRLRPGILAVLVACVLNDFWAARAGGEVQQHAAVNAEPQYSALSAAADAILKRKCFACHGEHQDDVKGSLDLTTRAAMLKGGESGEPALVPGDPDGSPLCQAVRWDGLEMPPKENDRLTQDEIALIRSWISAGAPWEVGGSEVGGSDTRGDDWNAPSASSVAVRTSGGISPEWTNRRYEPDALWAYQPLSDPAIPGDGRGHPIDAFLEARMQSEGFVPAGPAEPRTLMRRLTFDLTGLPPRPDDVDAFVAGFSEAATRELIDRLLASPQYGEQMARHWLDVVRYADTAGYANDYERPHAWRYRDYVVRSFNADKPYDRFVLEQLAGDELDPDDPDCLIATGFLRMGPWEQTDMSVATVTRQQFLDDVTQSVGVTFLAHGLRCASCHDHKFDPVPTRDYYRIQAVFAPVQFVNRELDFLDGEHVPPSSDAAELARLLQKRASALKSEYKRQFKQVEADFLAERGASKILELSAADREAVLRLIDREYALERVYRKHDRFFSRAARRFEPFAYSVYSGPDRKYNSQNLTTFLMPAEEEREGKPASTHILMGGSLSTPGEQVTPGVLSAVSYQAPATGERSPIPESVLGRRLAFANWVVSAENPLTARVIVNRVWQMHFGTGLAATPNNFGKMGARPSHPALLDWLARWLMDHDWSLKELHRLILTSAAYQRSSVHADHDRLAEQDPHNTWLAYFPRRRLSAEELRDAMLAASGELNREAGGPGCFPEINWDIAHQLRYVMGTLAPAYEPSPRRRDRNRRTLYAFRIRTLSDPLLEVFDRPGAETSCQRRTQTTVTPQVFALFNSSFAQDRSIALAARLMEEGDSLRNRIVEAFRLVAGRRPDDHEMALCETHVQDMTEHHRQTEPVVVHRPTVLERKLYDEASGGTFQFEEELLGMKDYEFDLKPWDVSPETRALAELCVVLFNSNEFVYVR